MTRTTKRRRPAREPRYTKPRENSSTTVLWPEQIAAEMGVSKTIVYRKLTTGELRGIRVSPKRWVIHRDDYRLWMDWKRGLLSEAEYRAALKAPVKATA